MSQVLEKPILLDETGQEIVEKLDDIKEAIGTSSEFIPVMIKVVTPPTKTTYKVGEHLDLSGIVVNLVGSNGVQIDVTQACTFSPANGAVLTNANTSVAISYHYAAGNLDFSTSQTLTIRELDSIAVTTPPIKTAYQTGETLDLTGIVVTATYSDGYTANVTADCIFSPANGTTLTSSDTSVGVNYTEGSVTKSTSVAIGVKELVSIAVTHIPTKTAYHAGETLDLTGLVVTATYDDSTTLNVTNNCTFSPDDGDVLTTSDSSISITYAEGSTTKTASQAISVIGLNSIAITTPPTQTAYSVGDTLDLTGIVVTATYSDGSTVDVTSSCSFNPANGATLSTLNTSVTVTYTEYGNTKTATQAITVSYPIYGAEWDGTATTAWTRTDKAADFSDPVPYYLGMSGTPSSPFDNIAPWSGIERVEDADAGSLVKIPKFYYKLSQNGSAIKVQIANTEMEGFSTSPAHMDRGDGEGERDYVYVGRYHCNASYKSATGVQPVYNVTRANARTYIHNKGADIWQIDFAMVFTIWLLYLVEFADWNTQNKIGYGGGSGSGWENMGYTDTMPYHTGTMAGRTTYSASTQYRYIEGLWDNVEDFVDGCYYGDSGMTAKGLSIILNPSNFGESGGVEIDGGVNSNYDPSWVKELTVYTPSGLFPVFLPTNLFESNGGEGYTCDTWDFKKSARSSYYVPTLGGSYGDQNKQIGLFRVGYGNTSTKGLDKGCRLMKLP